MSNTFQFHRVGSRAWPTICLLSAALLAGPAGGAEPGAPAPDIAVIADFDSGRVAASYGIGWHAADDTARGGNSRITQHLVEEGAQGTHGALEIRGEVGTRLPYPYVGTSFMPNGTQEADFDSQGYSDYSNRATLSFWARGDGQNYLVVIMGPASGATPGMHSFAAGEDWQEVRVPLASMAGVDVERIRLISIGTMTPGPFRFQIDNVRMD